MNLSNYAAPLQRKAARGGLKRRPLPCAGWTNALAERLITYDTSTVEGLRAAAGFIKGWLEAREIGVADHQYGDGSRSPPPSGPPTARRWSSTATTTSSRAPEQFEPRMQGDRLTAAAPTT